MEAEILSMVGHLFYPDNSDIYGLTTSGGTESIIFSVYAHKKFYKKKKPNIILPMSAHAAFYKAAEYFSIEIRMAPLN